MPATSSFEACPRTAHTRCRWHACPPGTGWRGAFVLLLAATGSVASAQSLGRESRADTRNTPIYAPGLTGDWGGARTRLSDDGVDIVARYTSESAYNFTGGKRDLYRETGEFDVGVTIDTEKLLGWTGGAFKTVVTYRRGRSLGIDADLDVLLQVQEIYGRGQTLRLTQFWYEQRWGDVSIKAGRVSPSEDFTDFSCYFQNLTFCGAPAGSIVGDYWFAYPVSQWGARLRVGTRRGSLQIGAYEINPKNVENDFVIGHFKGATGIMVPVQVGFAPKVGRGGLIGVYKIGGWYSTNDGDDVFLDARRAPQVLTGLSALQRSGRYGVYLNFQQQLTGTVVKGEIATGIAVFLNITQADRRTATTDNQIAAGLFLRGLFPKLPEDTIGFAVGRTNVNGRVTRAQRLDPAQPVVRTAEYVAEAYYSAHATDWLIVRPNLQFVHHPGGVADAPGVGVLGLKATILF